MHPRIEQMVSFNANIRCDYHRPFRSHLIGFSDNRIMGVTAKIEHNNSREKGRTDDMDSLKRIIIVNIIIFILIISEPSSKSSAIDLQVRFRGLGPPVWYHLHRFHNTTKSRYDSEKEQCQILIILQSLIMIIVRLTSLNIGKYFLSENVSFYTFFSSLHEDKLDLTYESYIFKFNYYSLRRFTVDVTLTF